MDAMSSQIKEAIQIQNRPEGWRLKEHRPFSELSAAGNPDESESTISRDKGLHEICITEHEASCSSTNNKSGMPKMTGVTVLA